MQNYRKCKLVSITCDECGKGFKPGCDKHGLPNGVAFKLTDGSRVDICSKCVIKYGKEEETK